MYCENCGNQLNDDALFCDKCGAKIEQEDPSEQEYTSLVPKFEDVDTEKPITDRIRDIEKPIFSDEEDIESKPRKKKSKVKLIVSLSVTAIFLIAIGVIVFICTRPLTPDKAYSLYSQKLAGENDYYHEYYGKEITLVTAVDINNTGIPDLIYTIEYENGCDVHMLYDDDIIVSLVGLDSVLHGEEVECTVFISMKDGGFYIYSIVDNEVTISIIDCEDGKYHSKDIARKSIYYENGKPFYDYYIYDEEYDDYEKAFMDLTETLFSDPVTIIISTLPREALKSRFNDIQSYSKCYSFDDALQLLNDGELSEVSETESSGNGDDAFEPTEEPSTEEPVDNTPEWSDVYKDFILDKEYLTSNDGWLSNDALSSRLDENPYPYFYLYDLDNDNTPELFMSFGYIGGSTPNNVYTVRDNKIVFLSDIMPGSDLLIYNPDSNNHGLFCGSGRQGAYAVTYWYITGDTIESKQVLFEKAKSIDDFNKGFDLTVYDQDLYDTFIACTDESPLYPAASLRTADNGLSEHNPREIASIGWDNYLTEYGY